MFALFAAFLFATCYGLQLEEVASFSSLNYTWDVKHSYTAFVKSKAFIVENCLLAGINVDRNANIYVTVPRWKNGVPATLNKLVMEQGSYLLQPFPDWDMQREGVDGDLQNVQSMTIDKSNRMWIIEVGRRNFYTIVPDVAAAAGVWLVDLSTNAVLDKYYFPESIVSHDNSFLNDIVVDDTLNGERVVMLHMCMCVC